MHESSDRKARPGRRRVRGLLAAVVSVAALAAVTTPGIASAAPTAAAAYGVEQTSVSRLLVSGFGGGTIYYPDASGPFGAVAISPGFTATESSIAWLGPRLAEQGFVVFTIDTNTIYDQPASRGDQLLAALDYLTQRSSVRGRVDASRLGVMGHSMGGGGTLEAAKERPSLKAAIPLTGWNTDKTWPEISTPTLVIGADGDSIAPVLTHSQPFYTSLPGTLDKAYLELNNATHFTPNTSNSTIATYSIAWLKRFLDGDTSYNSTLCPGPGPSLTVDEYRSTCPF